jgi:hypothetical protein
MNVTFRARLYYLTKHNAHFHPSKYVSIYIRMYTEDERYRTLVINDDRYSLAGDLFPTRRSGTGFEGLTVSLDHLRQDVIGEPQP